MAKILVTGSSGTLGVPLCRELRTRGHEVFTTDLAHTSDANHHRADISNYRQVERVFGIAEPEAVYNLAAEFGRMNGQNYYEQLWLSNQVGNQNIIEACLRNKARFILAGSSEAYGDSDLAYLKEDWLDTNAPFFHNQYALSKWAQEQQTFIAAKNKRLKATVLRFFNAYGEGEYYSPYRSVVCLFCYRLMHGLPITVYRNYHRVFMHVDDWAKTVANVVERDLPSTSPVHHVPIYNIGGTEYRSVEDLSEVIIEKAVSYFNYNEKQLRSLITYVDKEFANVTNKRPDVSLAARDLDHNPRIVLEDGVYRTLAWMSRIYGRSGNMKASLAA